MGSLRGFGNTFGDVITQASLNNLAANSHGARTMMSEGIMFDAIAGGTVYNDNQEVVDVDAVLDRCPFAIYNLTYNKDTEHYTINVWPGTINNIVPDSDDNVLLTDDPPPYIQVFADGLTSSTTTNYVYLKCGNKPASGDTPAQYPVHEHGEHSKYPHISIETDLKYDDDDYSYFLIGIVQGSKDEAGKTSLKITKLMGCNSLWTERFKCGTNTAQYWWSAV